MQTSSPIKCISCSFNHFFLQPENQDSLVTRQAYFDITIGGRYVGRILFGIFEHLTPITSENFVQLCTGVNGYGYVNSIFHRTISDFMIQGMTINKHQRYNNIYIYTYMYTHTHNIYIHRNYHVLNYLSTRHLNYVDDTKYLRVTLSCDKLGDMDKFRQMRHLYAKSNRLLRCFTSVHMKN